MAAEMYPCFLGIEGIGLFQVPLGKDAKSLHCREALAPKQPALNPLVTVYTPVKQRSPAGVKSIAQEHNNHRSPPPPPLPSSPPRPGPGRWIRSAACQTLDHHAPHHC